MGGRKIDLMIAEGFVAVLLAAAFMIFFLSLFAPSQNEQRFWVIVRKLRNVLDLVCYWIFNLFAILAILCLFGTIMRSIFSGIVGR